MAYSIECLIGIRNSLGSKDSLFPYASKFLLLARNVHNVTKRSIYNNKHIFIAYGSPDAGST